MNWNCPNCGKRVEFSAEQLAETRGVVVCPQCLSSDKVPGYDAPHTSRAAASTTSTTSTKSRRSQPSAPSQSGRNMTTPPPHNKPSTPPPHRRRISFVDKEDTPKPDKPQKSTGKKKKAKTSSKGLLAPKSALGCLWRSVVYTMLLLIAYIVVGLLLQGI